MPETSHGHATPPPHNNHETHILFAVWFREDHGAERYREYLTEASPIASKYGAHRVDGLIPVETLRGVFDPDYISIISWPDIENYYAFLRDMHYRTIAPLLEEAVSKRVVVHCKSVH